MTRARLFLIAVAATFGLGLLYAQTATVTNPASSLSGKTLLTAQDAAIITGLHTYSRGGNAPFAVSTPTLVPNLNAQFINGLATTAFARTPSVITTTLTGSQNDFVLTGATAGAEITLLCNNATLLTLTGILFPVQDGTQLNVISIGAGQVDFVNASTSSAASDRILNGVTSTLSLSPGSGRATLVYNNTEHRWRMLAHEQGNWINVVYSSSYFGTSGTMTWTVDAGDVVNYSYYIKGKTEWVNLQVLNSTVGGSLDTTLLVVIPGIATAAKSQIVATPLVLDAGLYRNATVGSTIGTNLLSIMVWLVGNGSNQNYHASTDQTVISFVAPIEMQ